MKPVTFGDLIEMTLDELIGLEPRLPGTDFLSAYCRILILYLQADSDQLEKTGDWDRFELDPAERQFLEVATQLRRGLRRRTIAETLLARAEVLAGTAPAWSGELYFLIALAHDILSEHEKCKEANRKAIQALDQLGARRKSLKAFHNWIAAESRLHPERNLYSEYHHVYRRALDLQDDVTAGLALNNLARDYHQAGAHMTALGHVTQAISHLQNDFGSLHYFLALLNRAHILIDLSRFPEAKRDMDSCRVSTHLEIQAGLKVLDLLFEQGQEQQQLPAPVPNPENLNFTWKERLDAARAGNPPLKLTKLEDILLHLLSEGPKTRFELIPKLYGTSIAFEVLENRFKNLLNRVKKKHPGKIRLENGAYRLLREEDLLPEPLIRKSK